MWLYFCALFRFPIACRLIFRVRSLASCRNMHLLLYEMHILFISEVRQHEQELREPRGTVNPCSLTGLRRGVCPQEKDLLHYIKRSPHSPICWSSRPRQAARRFECGTDVPNCKIERLSSRSPPDLGPPRETASGRWTPSFRPCGRS